MWVAAAGLGRVCGCGRCLKGADAGGTGAGEQVQCVLIAIALYH